MCVVQFDQKILYIKMKLKILWYLKNCGTPPQISFKAQFHNWEETLQREGRTKCHD